MSKEPNFAFSGDFGDDDAVADCDECGKTWPVEDLVMAKYEPAGWVWNKDGDAYICPNCTGVKP